MAKEEVVAIQGGKLLHRREVVVKAVVKHESVSAPHVRGV